MKLGILAASISSSAGGIFAAMLGQCKALHDIFQANIQVFGLDDARSSKDAHSWKPLTTCTFTVKGPVSFGYSPDLFQALQATKLDLVHVHGLWMYPSLANLQLSKRRHCPYIISPHGMLDPWALRNSAWKKRLAKFFYEETHLRGAACIHAVSRSEARSIREYGLSNPICVVPNGVDLISDTASCKPGTSTDEMELLYVGRLHPKKNLRTLLYAWQEICRRGNNNVRRWKLTITGWDQNGHQAELKELAYQLGVDGSVRFSGPQYGAEKDATFSAAQAFILPSLSEGLPMAVLEAWSHGLPVLITPECNLPEAFEVGAGIQIGNDSTTIADGLAQLFDMEDEARRAMGKRGRELVNARFTWSNIARQMYSVYRWILGVGAKPDCVVD
ncbi:MAG: glycosyl transferase, group 1 [Nitrospira sp.]|jgi:poly(glycerol-phosphate) alpha-glucosyltransferase|nr:MAG: glycosyl transferase, group 1 [Nitrospira sp.]